MTVLLIKKSILGKKTVRITNEDAEQGLKDGTLIKRGAVYVEAAIYGDVPRFKPKKARKKAEQLPVEEEEKKPEPEQKPAPKPEPKPVEEEAKRGKYDTKVMKPEK